MHRDLNVIAPFLHFNVSIIVNNIAFIIFGNNLSENL